ncbi:hypothetical protein K3495_g9921 [Podosphaera aphanis]|nr:hypothetical protein K3495_g9921 [Podosphaera aphanis]
MSSPMIAWEPRLKRFFQFLTSSIYPTESVDLPSVQIHQIETAVEKRTRTLKHLLRANHLNYSILFHDLTFHNHLPHLLGSAYLLGADAPHLQNLYDEETKMLEAWVPSPAEITDKDWRHFLGDKQYQRAFIDFFEDENALKFDYNWKTMVEEYLFSGDEPLFHGLVSGLGHPLIHLAYAYELTCKELAIEALAQTSVCYDILHKYLDSPHYTKPSDVIFSPRQILDRIQNDTRLDNLFSDPGPTNIVPLLTHHEEIVLEYWNMLAADNSPSQLQACQDAAIDLLTHTVQTGTKAYDFFIVHVLTTSHAARILLPFIPKQFHLNLLRQLWLLTICVYIAQLRPEIKYKPETIPPGTSWAHVEQKSLQGSWATDAHYIKAIRAIKEAAFTWGDPDGHYLAAATKFADGFNGWTGFPPNDGGEDYLKRKDDIIALKK